MPCNVCFTSCCHRRFDLTYHTASDEAVFEASVLEARQQREAESLQVLKLACCWLWWQNLWASPQCLTFDCTRWWYVSLYGPPTVGLFAVTVMVMLCIADLADQCTAVDILGAASFLHSHGACLLCCGTSGDLVQRHLKRRAVLPLCPLHFASFHLRKAQMCTSSSQPVIA